MIQFNIEVIAVSKPTNETGKGGGKYQKVEATYKRLDRDGKVEGKPFFDFSNKDIFNRVSKLVSGEVKSISAEKDPNGYWQWTAINEPTDTEKMDSNPADSSPARKSYPAKAGVGKVTGSNYETKEERAARQILIVRQSSLATAVAYFASKQPKGSTATVEDVIAVASKLEDTVFGRGLHSDAARKEKAASQAAGRAFEDMEDDLPT